MVTQEELAKLDEVFIKHQEGTCPDWCEDGGMDYLDNTFVPVARLDASSQHSIKIDSWVLGYDCFFTEDPRDLAAVASDMRKDLEDLCSFDYEITGDIEESLVNQPHTGYVPEINEWSDKHYDFKYELTEEDIANCYIKIDPYFISKQWGIGSKDDSGALWHSLKTIARFGDKHPIEREVRALNAQIIRMAELYGVEL